VLRWGPGYNGEDEPLSLLRDVIDAEEIKLDRSVCLRNLYVFPDFQISFDAGLSVIVCPVLCMDRI